jgi:hypothetical protein
VFSQHSFFVPSLSVNAQRPKARLPFYAVMLLVLWVMVASQFSKNLDFSDDSSRVRVEQAREVNSDSDSNLDDFPTFDGVFQENVVFGVMVVTRTILASIDVVPLQNLLIQIRPRSPPL